jgi:hypothetical protein
MWAFDKLVREHPWQMVAGAFLVGVGLALDRHTRRAIALAGLQIGRAVVVEHARRYLRAWAVDEPTAYARA